MLRQLAQKAIFAALRSDWDEAVRINRQILELDSSDVSALNRLAKAYFELGRVEEAKRIAQNTLRIDPVNQIASKCLEKWSLIEISEITINNGAINSTKIVNEMFMDIPGKTKIATLINLGQQKVLAHLDAGDIVEIRKGIHKVGLTTNNGEYVGRLADNLASRMIRLLNEGYSYKTVIKFAGANEVKVLIIEKSRPSHMTSVDSFPLEAKP